MNEGTLLVFAAPVGLAFLIHFSQNGSAQDRMISLGLRAGSLAEPSRLLTHMIVHASDEHLFSNVITYCVTVAEYLSASPQGSPWVPLVTMVVGGIIGGVPAQRLQQLQDERKAKQQLGMGIKLVETVVGKVHKMTAERQYMVGASAAICSFSGFNAGYRRSFISACIAVLPDVLALLQQNGDGAGSLDFLRPGRQQVGYAAHIGGFAFGFVVGLAYRQIEISRRRRFHSPRSGTSLSPSWQMFSDGRSDVTP